MAQGVDWRKMAMLSQKIGIRGLKRLGILKGEEADLIEAGIIRLFYPHGLGHLLGLNVHDDGLGLVIQLPTTSADTAAAALSSEVTVEGFLGSKESPISLHHANTDLAPPSTRRSRRGVAATSKGSVNLFATPSTKLEPGMLLTVEPGIYFNPAMMELALSRPSMAKYLDEAVLRRYMSVGGVRIEDVVLVLPNGQIENITTAPKTLREVEQIVQDGQDEDRRGQQMEDDLLPGYTAAEEERPVEEKSSSIPTTTAAVAASATLASSEAPRKKHMGVFKKLIRAIRNMF